jgi:hypothetical protein
VSAWSIGVLEYWSIGVLEYWSIGLEEAASESSSYLRILPNKLRSAEILQLLNPACRCRRRGQMYVHGGRDHFPE